MDSKVCVGEVEPYASSADLKLILLGSVERATGQAKKAVGSADLHPALFCTPLQ
jgi:hypothetical protein